MSEMIGYARTSTYDQVAGLEAQIKELEAVGCRRIYSEHVSSFEGQERPELDDAFKFLREGDTFVVTRPDRLARSTRQLLEFVDDLTEKGVRVRILSLDLDTGSSTGRLMLTMLGAVAEFERTLMKERQLSGIAKAKAEGKYTGRKPTAQLKAKEVKAMYAAGKNPTDIARELGLGRSSVYRVIKDDAAAADQIKAPNSDRELETSLPILAD